MRPALGAAYHAAAAAAAAAAQLVPAGATSKVARSLAARRDIRARYAAWGAAHRDASRPLLWLHAPSVGEGLQARPVAQLVRERLPYVQLAYTFFSPSAERFAATIGADFADYLPFDTAADARATLDALRPTALVFSKLDVWPVLVAHAAARGATLGLLSATLAAGSSRRGALVAPLLRPAYASLNGVGAISEDDARRLVALGVRRAAATVTGDVRYDQVWARAYGAQQDGSLLPPLRSARPTLVAGSTWPADEARLFPAWVRVRARVADARLVLAPHEPTAAHLAPALRWAAASGLSVARLGEPGAGTADVVLVDRVGVLGDLYPLADVAYVGGGFHRAGLHSVLEPAAFGAPVLVGPRHQDSHDAVVLLARGGARSAANADGLGGALADWFLHAAPRAAAGARAREVVEAGLGAAERSFALVAALLGTTAA